MTNTKAKNATSELVSSVSRSLSILTTVVTVELSSLMV